MPPNDFETPSSFNANKFSDMALRNPGGRTGICVASTRRLLHSLFVVTVHRNEFELGRSFQHLSRHVTAVVRRIVSCVNRLSHVCFRVIRTELTYVRNPEKAHVN